MAFAAAVVASILPWTRFGIGSSAFGAWGTDLRWSLFAAIAACAGLALWWAARALGDLRHPRTVDLGLALVAACVAAGAALSLFRPPPFTRTWIGPWVALVAGAVGCAVALAARRRRHAASPRGNVVDSA